MPFVQFQKERDEALLSLDPLAIEAFMRKYNIPVPKDEMVFWAAVHNSILYLDSATLQQKLNSYDWLLDHWYCPSMLM